jgi:hypothetical protein
VFLAAKPLFLNSSDDFAVSNDTSSAIMIKTGNAEDIHFLQKNRCVPFLK